MTTNDLYNFIRQHNHGVLATVSADRIPESAYVGIAVTPDLKIIFDTVTDSRKYQNLLSNSNIAFVIGWDKDQTVQYQGTARIPDSSEIDALLETYFEVFHEGRERRETWKNIVYFCVEPNWIRYSDFRDPVNPIIEEVKF